MWLEKLRRIEEINLSYGEEPFKGTEEIQYREAYARFQEEYKIGLPEEYFEFLSHANGMDFNGYCVYGMGETVKDYLDISDHNEMLRVTSFFQKYIVMGADDINLYVMDNKSSFMKLTDSGDVEKSYKSFFEMLEDIFDNALE